MMYKYLYHYSTVEFTDGLKSRQAQRLGNTKWGDRYNSHISFFLEPIPIDLPKILNNRHAFWKDGVALYEYKVDINKLPRDVAFRLVESHEKTNLIRHVQNWDGLVTPAQRSKYMAEIEAVEAENGYVDFGINKLKRAIRYANSDIRLDFADSYRYFMADKPKPNELIEKYGPYVPHLMLYLGMTTIFPESITKITLTGK